MINFKPLELGDRKIFSRYLGEYNFNTYEYTFLTLYFWRKMCNTEFCIIDDTLVIKKFSKSTGPYFMQPIGYNRETLKSVILKLKSIKENNPEFKCLFADIETSFLGELKEIFGRSVLFNEDINNFDYIYDTQQLISLSGNKYHRKKNQYNQFVNNYDYVVRELCEKEVRDDCMECARMWYQNNSDKGEQLRYEMESIVDVLTNIELFDIKGIAVYVNDYIAGFAFGEQANNNMAIVHIEKGNLEYSGIYSFVNKTLAEKYFSDVNFINRQEDLGIPGLRKAKTAYQPIRLEKKYIVDLL